MKKYKFFYHYYKQKKKMSVHFRGSCTVIDNINCQVPCKSKYRKTQPYLVMEGYATSVELIENIALIQ